MTSFKTTTSLPYQVWLDRSRNSYVWGETANFANWTESETTCHVANSRSRGCAQDTAKAWAKRVTMDHLEWGNPNSTIWTVSFMYGVDEYI